MAPQNIPSAIVLTIGNEVVLFVGIFLRILMIIISVIMPLLSSRPRIQSLKHVQRKRKRKKEKKKKKTKKTRTWIFINGNSIAVQFSDSNTIATKEILHTILATGARSMGMKADLIQTAFSNGYVSRES